MHQRVAGMVLQGWEDSRVFLSVQDARFFTNKGVSLFNQTLI
jgi:hypothetical protein